MSDIQLVFECHGSELSNQFEGVACLEMLQETCITIGLTGFFLPQGDRYIGLFEGDDQHIHRQMEKLVCGPYFKNIHVLRECNS